MAQKDSPAGAEQPAAAAGATEQSWLATEQQFWQRCGSLPCGMVVASLAAGQACCYLAVNDAFCALTGYDRTELIGKDILGDVHPHDQPALDALIQQVMAGQTDRIETETRLLGKDGHAITGRLTCSAIWPPAGECYLRIFVEDVTAARQTAARLSQAEAELARSRRMESLGQLVDGIAHDFNNLLTVIVNYASLVRDEVSVAEATESRSRWEPVRWDIEQIEGAADRARRLLRHLLAFARRKEARPVLVDLGQATGNMTLLLSRALGENILIDAEECSAGWPVEVDPGLLEQAIMNIALNARDAMPDGGQLTIAARNIDTTNRAAVDLAPGRADAAELTELLPGRYVALCFTDTGAGMDTVIAQRAFEPFFTTKSGDQAAGLGLSAVAKFAKEAGGTAWLRSEPGACTTVTVLLPAATAASGAPESEIGCSGQQTSAGAVLVVDDEFAIRNVAYRILTSAGYVVTTAADGPEALGLLGEQEIPADLILADVVMPGMTASAFATRIQELRPGVRMLFMSGYELPDDIIDGRAAPWAQLISKPFSRATLLAKISQLMAVGAAAPAGTADADAPEGAVGAAAHVGAQATGRGQAEARLHGGQIRGR